MTSERFGCHLCHKQNDTRGKLKYVNMRYSTKQRLTYGSKHLKTHTKPFRCGTCQKGFALRSDLGRHVKSQHRTGNERYCCNAEHCKFTSGRKDNLRRHQMKAHGPALEDCPVLKDDQQQPSHQRPDNLSDAQLYSVSNLMRIAASGDLDRLETFLNADLTVETKADDQSTALHCSARAGQAEVVRFLLDMGADMTARNDKGRLSIHEALLSNSFETVELFLERLPRETLLRRAQELEVYLMRSNSISIVDAYITRLGDAFTNRKVSRKLHFAVRTGHAFLLARLLDNPDVNGNKVCVSSYAPIHVAAAFGRTSIMEVFISRDDIDKTLRTGYRRMHALHIAASKGHTAIVEQLIQHSSVEVNCRDKDQATPLHYAASNGHWETASLLLEHSDPMNNGHRNSSDVFPTNLPFNKGDLLHRLFRHPDFGGPNKAIPGTHKTILHVAAEKEDCEMIAFLLADPDIDVNKCDGEYGDTALIAAAKNGKLEAVRLLLQHKDIDVNQKDGWSKWTALEYAKHRKHGGEIVDLLVSHGAIDHRAKALTTVPTSVHIDDSQNTTLQPDHETHFDLFYGDMDDGPTEAWDDFFDTEEGVAERTLFSFNNVYR